MVMVLDWCVAEVAELLLFIICTLLFKLKSFVVATGVFPAKSVMVKLKAYQLVGTPFGESEF